MLQRTGAVPWSIAVPYILVLSTVFPYYAVFRKYYNRITAVLQSTYGNPDRAMAGGCAGGDADARHSGLYGRRAS